MCKWWFGDFCGADIVKVGVVEECIYVCVVQVCMQVVVCVSAVGMSAGGCG